MPGIDARHDLEVLVMWREAMKVETQTRGNRYKSREDDNINLSSKGTSRSYTVSRLQRESPALFAQVGVNLPESLALTPFTGPHLEGCGRGGLNYFPMYHQYQVTKIQ